MSKTKYDIAVIGYGNMAAAIIKYTSAKFKIICSDIDKQKLSGFIGKNVAIAADNHEAVANAKYILLAVKPQSAAAALDGIDFSGKILISVMAGTSIASIYSIAKGVKGVVRVMPNLNAIIGKSNNVYSYDGLSLVEKKYVESFLEEFGQVIEITENKMNIVTGLSGSGPAFVLNFLWGMISAGIKGGLSQKEARDLAIATLEGTAEHAKALPPDPYLVLNSIDDVIERICSPGGTTIEGVNHLEKTGNKFNIEKAVLLAKERAEELSS